ncbi:MAG: hypothetical protein C1943_00130 [Halochromatium sp.]|nr:hypothetical protein [Halochromatium sp.]
MAERIASNSDIDNYQCKAKLTPRLGQDAFKTTEQNPAVGVHSGRAYHLETKAMRRIAATLPNQLQAPRGLKAEQNAALSESTSGASRDIARSMICIETPSVYPILHLNLHRTLFFTLTFAASLVMITGCEQSESVQTGLRGTSMIQLYKPSQLAQLQAINQIPDPEPSDPYDPSFPMATELHQNVQVLTDLNALEFARLMNAISTWVAPVEGCSYCHNPANLASDEKFTKIVSREMLKMTRSINSNWKSHVVETGVTCWTCHRGQPIPSDIWFKAPEPKTPSAGISGQKGGQNVSGVAVNGNSSLPFDPLTPFLDQSTQIAVQGTEVLPYGNRRSIKQAEWTYSLMMYFSKSLGVNCTYCHQTRAMGVWDQSTPQRVTAWHGIRLVRDINNNFLSPLKLLYPADRLGPEGDAPKTACATCHKGTYKPLFGQTMLNDYPSLAGVLPGRLDAKSEAAAIQALSQASPAVLALSSAEVFAETTAVEQVPEPAPEPVAEPAPDTDALSTEAENELLNEQEAQLHAAKEAASALSDSEARIAAVEARIDEEKALLQESLEAARKGATEAQNGTEETLAEAQADQLEAAQQRISALGARLDQERLALRQQLEVVRKQRDHVHARMASMVSRKQHQQALAALEQQLGATEARLDQTRHALQQQLVLVRGQRDMAQAQAQQQLDELHALHEDVLAKQRQQIAALETRLEQNLVALNQQLEVVRAQRDQATEAAQTQVVEITDDHEDALAAKQQRIAAMQARLDQNRTALEQQLAVVRAQRDAAAAHAEDQIAAKMDVHKEALESKQQQIAAMQARLEQNRHALEQQLSVVRRQAADESTKARLTELTQTHETRVDELEQQIKQTEARLAEERERLQQRLKIAREERDALVLETEAKVAELSNTLAAERDALAQMRDQHGTEVATLKQQLAQAGTELEQMRSQMAQAKADHAEALAAAKGSVTRIRLQPQDAEEIGGRLTNDGILVNLGSDELRFASGSAALPRQQLPTLDRTAALLAARPELSARIEGHTDSIGSAEANQALSQQRAEAVRQALIERGIDPLRIAATGAGAEQPVADNATAEGRRQNRRVEIYVTADDDPTGNGSPGDAG